MVKIKRSDIPEADACITDLIEKMTEEQGDPEFIMFMISGFIQSPEKAIGFMLCYVTIRNALIRQETEQLEAMFKENA